jgi:threonine/homoserine/homoserine lactone efflux protein
MVWSTWWLYVVAVVVLTVTPGPTVLMCVSNAVQFGPRRAMWSVLGSTTAIVSIMGLSALGLGAVLAASDVLFTALKWLGAGYLAWLGLSALLTRSAAALQVADADARRASRRQLLLQGLFVGASNPKALLFFSALFPQFLDPGLPQAPQFLVLCATFVFFELLWLTLYALLATRAKAWLQAPRRAVGFQRLTGAVFLLAAGAVALSRRPAA